jgi:beta-1,4-mannosyltransferase
MVEYEKMCHQLEGQGKKPRQLVLVVTGSGERKKIYQEMIKENRYKWKYISIEMIWFKPDDYPKMIACADVGICLHYSSSGYDLPMKVVDMYGTGLPAIAANYIT